MEPTDITIEILKSIRDEIRSTNERVDHLRTDMNGLRADMNHRFGEVNVRIDRLHDARIETDLRLSTEVLAVGTTLIAVRDELRLHRTSRSRLDDHEHRIEALESKKTG